MTEDLVWPQYATPGDLAAIEAVPIEERGLPESTYALLTRAARGWPDRTAVTVLPDATCWREPLRSVAEVHDIVTATEGSSVVATVKIHPSAQEAAVKAILGRYAIEWRLVVLS